MTCNGIAGGGAIDRGINTGGIDYKPSIDNGNDDDFKKNRFGAENFPGGLFTVPNPSGVVAYNNSMGVGEGGFQA